MFDAPCSRGRSDGRSGSVWNREHCSAELLRRFGRNAGLLGVIVVVVLVGCHLGASRITPSPLTYAEQERAIFELVPSGTPRDEVVRKLDEAGISGTFGIRETVYYCDVWKRDDGTRWHVDVALLFDAEGRLYQARRGQAQTSAAPEGTPASVAAGAGAGANARDLNRTTAADASPVTPAVVTELDPADDGSSSARTADRRGYRSSGQDRSPFVQ